MQPRPADGKRRTEMLLAEAERLRLTLGDASARLGAFTEMLRSLLAGLPPDTEGDTDAPH